MVLACAAVDYFTRCHRAFFAQENPAQPRLFRFEPRSFQYNGSSLQHHRPNHVVLDNLPDTSLSKKAAWSSEICSINQ
jgi:hypothetical protein